MLGDRKRRLEGGIGSERKVGRSMHEKRQDKESNNGMEGNCCRVLTTERPVVDRDAVGKRGEEYHWRRKRRRMNNEKEG